jgi:hypothetical protein
MIWHKHIALIIEHHKIRQAYRGSCSRNSTAVEDKYSDDEHEQDHNDEDSNNGEDIGDATTQRKEIKNFTKETVMGKGTEALRRGRGSGRRGR